MGDTIELNDKAYTEEEVKEAVKLFVKAVADVWETFKETVRTFVKKAWEFYKGYLKNVIDNPVGYKRLLKMDQLKKYESMSDGKSNNWRKIHGLSLRRC